MKNKKPKATKLFTAEQLPGAFAELRKMQQTARTAEELHSKQMSALREERFKLTDRLRETVGVDFHTSY